MNTSTNRIKELLQGSGVITEQITRGDGGITIALGSGDSSDSATPFALITATDGSVSIVFPRAFRLFENDAETAPPTQGAAAISLSEGEVAALAARLTTAFQVASGQLPRRR